MNVTFKSVVTIMSYC